MCSTFNLETYQWHSPSHIRAQERGRGREWEETWGWDKSRGREEIRPPAVPAAGSVTE